MLFIVIAKTLKDYIITADTLVSFLTCVIVQSGIKNIVSNIEFISSFMTDDMRNGELACVFMNFNVAYFYLMKLEPGSSLVTTDVFDDRIPPQLADKLSVSEYKGIIGPIRDFAEKSDLQIRATGASKGAAIGAGVVTPIAVLIGVLTIGVGVPISVILLGAGAGIGSAFGAAIPLKLKKQLADMEAYVEHTNDCLLRTRGVVLLSPLASNSASPLGIAKVSTKQMRSLTWVIKSMPSIEGDNK